MGESLGPLVEASKSQDRRTPRVPFAHRASTLGTALAQPWHSLGKLPASAESRADLLGSQDIAPKTTACPDFSTLL